MWPFQELTVEVSAPFPYLQHHRTEIFCPHVFFHIERIYCRMDELLRHNPHYCTEKKLGLWRWMSTRSLCFSHRTIDRKTESICSQRTEVTTGINHLLALLFSLPQLNLYTSLMKPTWDMALSKKHCRLLQHELLFTTSFTAHTSPNTYTLCNLHLSSSNLSG